MRLVEIAEKNIKLHLEYHDTLNPKLWDEFVLKPDVKEKLKEITNAFLSKVKIEKKYVTDVIITGSNCNYNWSKLSDIDLHVVVDYNQICDNCGVDIDDCYRAKKSNWNDNHDIKIKGIDVELYIQSSDENFSSNAGIYSLAKDKWVRYPVKEEKLVYDKKEIKKKAKRWMDLIDDLIDNDVDDKVINNVKEKLRKLRQIAIARGGEFSLENMVFKTLRNNGYLDKLEEYKNDKENKELSLR